MMGNFIRKITLANGITYWECVQRRVGDGCKGRIVISADDTLLRVAIEHSHPSTTDKIEGIRSRAGMERTAHNTNEKTHNILITHYWVYRKKPFHNC